MTPSQIEFLNICQKHGFYPANIRSNRKDSVTVEKRRVVAKEMKAMGFSFPQIGAALDKDHSSIIHMVNDEYRARKNGARKNKRARERALKT